MLYQNGLFLVPKSELVIIPIEEPVYTERLEKNFSTTTLRPFKKVIKRDTVRSLVGVLGRKQSKSWRILDYLAAQRTKEVVAQFCTDLELSWFTVLRASEGNPDPWNFSFWMFFGKTYPKALKAWAERDEVNRKALERCAAMVRAENEKSCDYRPATGQTSLEGKRVASSPTKPQNASVSTLASLAASDMGTSSATGLMAPPSQTPANGSKNSSEKMANLYDSARQIVNSKKKPGKAA